MSPTITQNGEETRLKKTNALIIAGKQYAALFCRGYLPDKEFSRVGNRIIPHNEELFYL